MRKNSAGPDNLRGEGRSVNSSGLPSGLKSGFHSNATSSARSFPGDLPIISES